MANPIAEDNSYSAVKHGSRWRTGAQIGASPLWMSIHSAKRYSEQHQREKSNQYHQATNPVAHNKNIVIKYTCTTVAQNLQE